MERSIVVKWYFHLIKRKKVHDDMHNENFLIKKNQASFLTQVEICFLVRKAGIIISYMV